MKLISLCTYLFLQREPNQTTGKNTTTTTTTTTTTKANTSM